MEKMKKRAVPCNSYKDASLVIKPILYYIIPHQYKTADIAVTISIITIYKEYFSWKIEKLF
ncbi:hypothetical protein Holit_00220 [Hollandina sp. SP2]